MDLNDFMTTNNLKDDREGIWIHFMAVIIGGIGVYILMKSVFG